MEPAHRLRWHRASAALLVGGAAMVACGARAELRGARWGPSPRLVAPLTGSRVTTHRPTLRWRAPAAASDGTRVELCRERACTRVVAVFDVDVAEHARVPIELTPGTWFWRLSARADGAIASPPSGPWWFRVPPRDTPVDSAWGATFDPDGDGRPELAVGASATRGEPGLVHVYATRDGRLSRTVSLPVQGTRVGLFGYSLATGDFDGDGYADLAVGAPTFGPRAGEGLVEVYYGSAAGLRTDRTQQLASPPDVPGYWGNSLASAGDVNGDGYADLAVGASIGMGLFPRAFVLLGGPYGLRTPAATAITGPDPNADRYAAFVASAGDLNGDGLSDLVIGEAPIGTGFGRVYVHYGRREGIDSRASVVIEQPAFTDPWPVTGGDVDGDGYADLVVAAEFQRGRERRRMLGYHGGAAGVANQPTWEIGVAGSSRIAIRRSTATAIDLDGDGFDDALFGHGTVLDAVIAARGGPAGLVAEGVVARAAPEGAGEFYGVAVAFVDVDGDGRVEVCVGNPDAPGGGRVDVLSGSFDGLRAPTIATLSLASGAADSFGRALLGVEAP